ncbi:MULTISPECIES: hypothetical protein [Nonomuraea]|uniref:TfoX N-terminal domain-containing protein n=1 Tax=Nonomuraea mangrovi TaxID=2316207 RepID=A0ABW4SK84_9ACTN
MTEGKALYADLVAEHLTRPEVSIGRMLRNDGLKINGRTFAFISMRERLVVKLPQERAAALVAVGTAHAVEMGTRRMREWVEIPELDEDTWRALMEEAAAYVETLA